MTTNLVSMCCECKKIRIGDNTWIGREHPYYALLSKRPDISDGYCPEHLNNNRLRKKKELIKVEYFI